MRITEMSRLVVMCLVFLMAWRETLQIPTENDVRLSNETRSKRYHESDERSYASEIMKNKSINELKVPIELVNQVSQARPSNLGVPHKTPARAIPQSKIIRVMPIIANANKNNLPKHKPYLFYVNNNELPKRPIQRKSTIAVEGNSKVQERELEVEDIVDTEDVEKSQKIRECGNNNNNNIVETNVTEIVDKKVDELDEVTEALKTQTNDMKKTAKTTEPKKIKKSRKSNDKNENESKTGSENSIKKKTSRNYQTKISNVCDASAIEAKQAIILNENITKGGNMTEKSTARNEELKLIDQIKTKPSENQAVIEHPFLEAIQNSKYLTCSPCDKPNLDLVNECKNDKNDDTSLDIKSPAVKEISNEDSLEEIKISQEEKTDENEDVLVRHSKYDEFQEIAYSNDLKNLQIDNVQKSNDPYSSYQGPYNYYQDVSRPYNADNECHNNQYNYDPDEQKVEQVDGATVISYKNYYKTPKPYWNNNRNYYNPTYPYNNNYGNCKQRQLSYNNGVYKHQPSPYLGDARTRIWKSWKNTEYLIKSKNAVQQIRNGNVPNNGLMNPINSRNMNNIQRTNAVPGGF